MTRKDKRQEIMQAAEVLFRDRRYHEVTLDEVAQKARVGKGTIYRYFADKDDLFFQTASSGFDDLCELLQKKVPETGPFRERLLTACVEIGHFHHRRRHLTRMMQQEEGRALRSGRRRRERWLTERRKLLSALSDILRQGAAEGAVRGDVPPEVLAGYLLGMLRTRVRDLPDVTEEFRSRELLLELFLDGAGVQHGTQESGRSKVRNTHDVAE
jgi:AcrR family transcriptional regulator